MTITSYEDEGAHSPVACVPSGSPLVDDFLDDDLSEGSFAPIEKVARTMSPPVVDKADIEEVLDMPKLVVAKGAGGALVEYKERRPVQDEVRHFLSTLHMDSEDPESAFYVVDLGAVRRQHLRWVKALPRVEPFYAIKCCPDDEIVRLLASLGVGFDCASMAELEQVLGAGVSPDRIVYANCCKPKSHVKYAKQHGVELMTFDNAHELRKIAKMYPGARTLLRILADDSHSLCKLGTKFGAPISRVAELLRVAREEGVCVEGVSFHVGSGCFDAVAFGDAVRLARRVFDIAESMGFEMSLLDCGGGFPGSDAEGITFEEVAKVLSGALDELFPPSVRVIAEPGRFYACSSHTLATNVIAKRTVTRDADVEDAEAVVPSEEGSDRPAFMYYVNDGVYGSFNCLIFDHATLNPQVLPRVSGAGRIPAAAFQCSLWGPTCDSMDCLTKETTLPELEIGDWLYFEDMGAYTKAAASTFNGFDVPPSYYIDTFSKC